MGPSIIVDGKTDGHDPVLRVCFASMGPSIIVDGKEAVNFFRDIRHLRIPFRTMGYGSIRTALWVPNSSIGQV